ncbi:MULTISPECIES: lasso peptide biosynthesis B2 protein [Peribacillus]|uniref:lasso peptide biosynthesis B2 protein n=1 Tax=Peribacillus TaxID=2675229 RepID=UPI001F4E64B1|nr:MULTISPECIES: lasso peptide biosynthesis B2 protein [unclassified Peribacillus]MCK1982998.1 lasso peptide biosynthesis B2 protein [Peribacillus sp. Aquil_B1]MCK2011177.1 lasso peptide biosynthesis B2 protein [Peribacillus sp. Aquil_B8]
MNLYKKINTFISFNRSMKGLLFEALFFLAVGRIFKLLPFIKSARLLGNHMEETSHSLKCLDKEVIKNISDAIHIMSRYTFWESQCLVKAVAGMKMLERRGMESTVYFGTARDEKGDLIAHAWLRSGPYYVTGAEEMGKFIVVGKFAKTKKA